jgi:O-antigen ligase
MVDQSTLPHRVQPRALSSPTPVVIAGLLAALVVGILVARHLVVGVTVLLALIYVPVVLSDLALGIAIWIPLIFLERVPAAGRAPAAVGIMVALAWLGTLPLRGREVAATVRENVGLAVLLVSLLAWVSLSTIWSVDPSSSIQTALLWWIAIALLLIVATSLTRRRHLVMVCTGFVIGALFSVVAGVLPNIPIASDVAGTAEAGRFVGSYGDPNFLAAGLVPALAICVGLVAVLEDLRWRIALAGTAIVLIVGLLASGSRGGLVAAAVAIVAAVVLARGRRLPLVAAALAVVLLGAVWFGASSSSGVDRIREFGTGNGRVDLWRIAIRMGEAHPIDGVGIGGFPEAASKYLRRPGRLQSGQLGAQLVLRKPHETHNMYLQMFAETGLVGLLLLVAAALAALRATWLAVRSFELAADTRFATLARSLLVAQLGTLTASFFISNSSDKRTWLLLALGPAALAVARRGGGRREASTDA